MADIVRQRFVGNYGKVYTVQGSGEEVRNESGNVLGQIHGIHAGGTIYLANTREPLTLRSKGR